MKLKSFLLSLFVFLSLFFSCSVTLARPVLPLENAVYTHYDKHNKLVSTLSVHQAGNNIWYAVLQYPEQQMYFVGKIIRIKRRYYLTMDFKATCEEGVMKQWQYPFYLDTIDNDMYPVMYKFKMRKGKFRLVPVKRKYKVSNYGYPEISGMYRKSIEIPFVVSQPLTAYILQSTDVELQRRLCSSSDVSEWWFDDLEAGDDFQLGHHPRCIWATPYDSQGNPLGNFLLGDDLSVLYKDNVKVF